MPLYPVSEKKSSALEEKLRRLHLKESDFVETFTRGGGPGGQNVNKVSTRVVIRHLPTGLEVQCRRERSQALNRYLAKRLLVEKIEAFYRGIQTQRQREMEKVRRQKRRRSRRAKEKMLEAKHRRSKKKVLRGRVGWED